MLAPVVTINPNPNPNPTPHHDPPPNTTSYPNMHPVLVPLNHIIIDMLTCRVKKIMFSK